MADSRFQDADCQLRLDSASSLVRVEKKGHWSSVASRCRDAVFLFVVFLVVVCPGQAIGLSLECDLGTSSFCLEVMSRSLGWALP